MSVRTQRRTLRVTAAQECGFRLLRHGLLAPETSATGVDSLAETLFGLHAARQMSPWVALRSRLSSFQAGDLRTLLATERTLIKLRCMRQTLHILPISLAATAHHATLHQRLGPCRARLRALGRTERSLLAATDRVREHLDHVPVRYRRLEAVAAKSRRADDVELARLAIKIMWETGELAHVDLSPSLHHEHRAFALTKLLFPNIHLSPEPSDIEAVSRELVLHHIRCFGPVSVADTAWWSGLGVSTATRAVQQLGDELVLVRIRGVPSELFVTVDAADELDRASSCAADHVAILAHEDPSLKGYFATRSRYVSPRHYSLLFNQIGEARASILLGGRAAGTWGFSRRSGRVSYTLFRRVSAITHSVIRERLADMEYFLSTEPVLVPA